MSLLQQPQERRLQVRPADLQAGPPALLRALAGVHAVDRDGRRVILHSGDTDATVAALVRSGLGWSDLDVGGLDLETSFLRLLGATS